MWNSNIVIYFRSKKDFQFHRLLKRSGNQQRSEVLKTSVAAFLMKTSGNLQIRKLQIRRSGNQADEKHQEIRRETWRAEGLCGHLPDENIRNFENQEMGKSGDQEIKLKKKHQEIRKGRWRAEGLCGHLACAVPTSSYVPPPPSSCSTHWSHWSALINNSLPLKPDFHGSLNKFVVGPAVGCCHIWQVALLSWNRI